MRNLLLAVPVALTTAVETCNETPPAPPLNMHTPVAARVFDIRQKGDVQARVLYATHSGSNATRTPLDKVKSTDVQVAAAITPKLAIEVFGSFKQETNGYDPQPSQPNMRRNDYRRNEAGLALGYYKALDNQKQAVFSVYGGFGAGRYTADVFTDPSLPRKYFYNTGINQIFAQPSLYLNISHFNCAFGVRFSSLGYSGVSTNYTTQQLRDEAVDKLTSGRAALLDGHMKIGLDIPRLPWLTLEAQLTAGVQLNNHIQNRNNSLLSGGLRFNLNKFRIR